MATTSLFLQAANVLLAGNREDLRGWVAKISDFGLSRVINENKNFIKTQTFGTVTHMPPELLSKGECMGTQAISMREASLRRVSACTYR